MSEIIKGKLEVKNREGSTAIVLNAGEMDQGIIELTNQSGESNLTLMGDGIMTVGGAGRIFLTDASKEFRIALAAIDQSLLLKHPDGGRIILKAQANGGEIRSPGAFHLVNATLRLGAEENGTGAENGTLFLCDADGKPVLSLKAQDDANRASIWVGGNRRNGQVVLQNDDSKGTIILDGSTGNIFLGNAVGKTVLSLTQDDANRASIWVGGNGRNGQVVLQNDDTKGTIILDGSTGDILLQNADCAEDFDVATIEEIEPGTVVVLDDEGNLRPSRDAYDKKVAGVISGAGNYRPGIVLDKQPVQGNRKPVALMGKVYCKVDAHPSPIEVGDLLTTSATPGHAMKAHDPFRAFGAVIGKALRPLPAGTGLIPILIALQ